MMKLINKLLLILMISAVIIQTSCAGFGYTYKDGVYSALSEEFAKSGWKETVEITIENGKLVAIEWDAIYIDENVIPIKKKQYSKSGLYGMMAAGANCEWYDQAIAMERHVVENGFDSLIINNDGYTDAVSRCTINVSEFQKLAEICLEEARV